MGENAGSVRRFVDIHSHIVYGADDGAGTVDEAMALLKLDREEGACAVFATPHYGSENMYTPDAAYVREKFSILQETAAKEEPELQLYLGTEWYCAWDLARRIHRSEAFRMNGTDYILTEFLEYDNVHEPAEKIRDNLAELQRKGFRPILAHPERYRDLHHHRDILREIVESGVLLQVNGFDLALNLSLRTRELAQWLAREHMISFIGSDMHGLYPKRTPRVKEGIEWLYENTDEAYADAVCFGNAERLLIGRQI